jgi:hypothetical protein
VSQTTFSRLVTTHRADVLTVGRARSTQYALRRAIPDVGHEVPVYEIDQAGGSRLLARLHAVEPGGFYVETSCADADAAFHPDLPWFLDGLRPSGFLGRLVPQQHPELGLPADIRHWSGDHCLRYLTRFGHDLSGSLIVGEEAFRLHLEQMAAPARGIAARERTRRYAATAEDVLAGHPPGSSAAGEQPKFCAWRDPGPTAVLVKFTPPIGDSSSRRMADLLVAEHLAHRVLGRHGHAAPSSQLLETSTRLFLEMDRFDRVASGGRRGVLSLQALDAEFVGRLQRWSESAVLLARAGRIDPGLVERVAWVECFGQLVGNTDMHFGNLSLFARGTRVVDLAPIYDMVPMRYAPLHGRLESHPLTVPIPSGASAAVWRSACAAAEELWQRVAEHRAVSPGFRRIAAANRAVVAKAAALAARLP